MSTYYTKCGKEIKKSTNAGTTGNRLEGYGPEHECYGCPHVIPLHTGYPQKLTGHECRCSPKVRYETYYQGSAEDKTTMRVYSLDVDFLAMVAKEAAELDGFEGEYKPAEPRAADYAGEDGLRGLTLYPSQNKKGMQAKKTLIDEFFNEDGSRKDISDSNAEKRMVLRQIEWYKAQAKAAAGVESADEAAAIAEEAPQDQAPDQDAGALQLPQQDAADAFDYGQLRQDDADYLRERAQLIRETTSSFATTMGQALSEAQARLADHHEGTFEKWYSSLGLKKRTVYNLIQRYQFISCASVAQPEVIEQLPLTLAYAISAPSAPDVLVQQVVDGDITSHAEYKRLQAELEKAKKEAEDLQFHYDNVHNSYARLEETNKKHYEDAEKERKKAEEYKAQIVYLNETLSNARNEVNRHLNESSAATTEIHKLKQQLQELEGRPVDVAVEAVSEEQLDELAQKARQEAAAAYEADRAALVAEIEKREEQFKKAAEEAAAQEARAKELEQLLQEAENKAPDADFETAWRMARDFAHTISTFEKLFVGASQGLDQDNYKMCADVLTKALDSMRVELRGTLSSYDAEPVERSIFDD